MNANNQEVLTKEEYITLRADMDYKDKYNVKKAKEVKPKKTERLNIRVTVEDKIKLEELAEEHEMNLSEFILYRCLGGGQ